VDLYQVTMQADWYFDFISPYPYLQLARFDELPDDLEIAPKPVLFAALLNHWGHKGPAEIPAKRRQTFIYTHWLANQRGLPFVGPPRHPFNPLAVLRLCVVAGNDLQTIKTIYDHIWGQGQDGQSEGSLNSLAEHLGITDYKTGISAQTVKDEIKSNTETAIARGVYCVPSFYCEGEVFWGDDMTPIFNAFLHDPDMFRRAPYTQIGNMQAAAVRKP
jgi:2-hydroxychromene-2-carboxylate isomerase